MAVSSAYSRSSPSINPEGSDASAITKLPGRLISRNPRVALTSAWLISDVQLDLIFDTRATQMWEAAIRRLGVDPSMLQMGSGVH